MTSMFCFQCEQRSKYKGADGSLTDGCTVCGVCGKNADTANLQDKVISSLIELSSNTPNDETTKIIIDGLFATITNTNFDNEELKKMIKNPKLDMNIIWRGNEDIRSLKSLILFGLKGMAAYAHHAWVLGYKDKCVNEFFYKGLKTLAKDLSVEELIAIVHKTGEVNFKCMEMLDRANTETNGNPEPTKVTKNIEAKPFIVITGHDLHDLKMLLEQTKDKGINIYTHGEMLPAHAYPELKKYEHLKGNFGTAWQNQQKEFDNIPGASKNKSK